MAKQSESIWLRLRRNLRSRLISGTVVMVPVFITVAILAWVFRWLSGFLTPAIKKVLEPEDLDRWFGKGAAEYYAVIVSVLAVILLVVLLYLVGAGIRRVLGRKALAIGEAVLLRIPLVKPIYSAAKQVVQAVSLPDRTAFKAVVLLHFPHPRMWALGFFTGFIADQTGKSFCKVFIPTTPNPTTGFFELVEAEELLLTDFPVEAAFKMIVSGGILAPESFATRPIGELSAMMQTSLPASETVAR